jgi:hypothetical protein
MGSSARTNDPFFKPELGDVYVILDLGMTGVGMWTTAPLSPTQIFTLSALSNFLVSGRQAPVELGN